jgi:hypothetical protein
MSTKDTELGLFRSIIQWIHYLFVREYIPSFCEVTDLVDGYEFTYSVIVKVVQSKKDLFIASCPTFKLSAYGKTFDEALNNLKSFIVDDYLTLSKGYTKGLSDEATSLLRLYCSLFGYDVNDILND